MVPFAKVLDSEGLSFGLSENLRETIGSRTLAGESCSSLLNDPSIAQSGILPIHLLRIRRAFRRYQALQEAAQGVRGEWRDRTGLQAARFAARLGGSSERQTALAGSFTAVVSTTLKRGRLRIHLRDSEDPRSQPFIQFAEHTEDCLGIPPHRFFSIHRGVKEGLVWIEVLCPEGEAERALRKEANPNLIADLMRASSKAVLDSITERAERQAISTAADALVHLLSRPPVDNPVAGVAVDSRQSYVWILGGEHDGESRGFENRESDRLVDWIHNLGIQLVGLTRIGGRGELSGLFRLFANRQISVEPVREAGLMKQARELEGAIRNKAAEVVAQRLKDPLEGYGGLGADELGLGEYLDLVDAGRLHAALEDARDVVRWERAQGKISAPVARGMATNQMIKHLSDLRPGMELTGVVSNLTDFGAFVELGLPIQGLIHLSELSEKFIQHPSEVVQVGDRVKVRVLLLDEAKRRLSLSMRERREGNRMSKGDKRAESIQALDRLFKK